MFNFSKTLSLLPDHEIKKHADRGMISPFVEKLKDSGKISYGLSSYGYDARLAPEFMWYKYGDLNRPAMSRIMDFTPYNQPHDNLEAIQAGALDPKDVTTFARQQHNSIEQMIADSLIIPPHEFVLGRTQEYFKIPDNVLAICMGKSTYARCGLIVNVTPLEPGWAGQVTLEISNTTSVPVKVYAHEGICQFLFYSNKKCNTTYSKRSGKYMNQVGVTLPRLKK